MRFTPSSAQFTHDHEQWTIKATPSDGVWLVTVECAGELVETFDCEQTKPAHEVVKQVILDRFGEEYGLV
jgi:hypothetical protein